MKYLASPYSDPNAHVRRIRYLFALRATSALIAQGLHTFSPIVHNHEVALEMNKHFKELNLTWDFWADYDKFFLAKCDELLVLMLPGWKDSAGVQAELKFADELGLPTRYLLPEHWRDTFKGKTQRITLDGHQRCTQCKQWKPTAAFYKKHARLQSICVRCYGERNRGAIQ